MRKKRSQSAYASSYIITITSSIMMARSILINNVIELLLYVKSNVLVVTIIVNKKLDEATTVRFRFHQSTSPTS